jgi:hypothetical protein
MKALATAASLVVLIALAAAFAEKGISDRTFAGPTTVAAAGPPSASGAPIPVIVELFTSEGCSSCPPADALLLKLENEQPIAGAEVLALEEHVDYWNNLGWNDPFSSFDYTARQYAYAGILKNGNAYTPQMVVNGQFEFIGSRSGEARGVIANAATLPRSAVSLTPVRVAADEGEYTVTADHLPSAGDPTELWIAVTETNLHSNVKAGENSGEDLHHAAVVRRLTKLATVDGRKEQQPYSTMAKVNFRPEWKRENVRVVVFLQEKKSRHILGAASRRLAE